MIQYDTDTSKICEAVADIDLGYRYHHREERWLCALKTYVCVALSCAQLQMFRINVLNRGASSTIPIPTGSHNKITAEAEAKSPTLKSEKPKKPSDTQAVPGAELPGLATSKIDVNAKPMYEPAGKPITQINIDEGIHHFASFLPTHIN